MHSQVLFEERTNVNLFARQSGATKQLVYQFAIGAQADDDDDGGRMGKSQSSISIHPWTSCEGRERERDWR